MRIRVTFAGWDPHDRLLFRLAGFSGIAHLGALVLFSILPRFISPMAPPPQATIAELIPASALGPPPAARAPQGASPSQRAAAAKEALEQKKTPPPPRREPAPKAPSVKPRPSRPDRTTPPPPGDRSEPKEEPESPSEPAADSPADSPADSEEPAGPPGGISFGSSASGLPGGVPSIGSSAFPYDYYRSILVTLLQSHWRRPVTPEGLAAPISCRVAFTIMKNGIVQEPRIVEGSGNASLDQSAIRAVYDSSPLPPLPFQYGHGSVAAEVVFELTPE